MSDSDGHTGIINKIIAQGESSTFSILLAYLKKSGGEIEYVIHTIFKRGYNFGLQPSAFFAEMGFNNYRGCPLIHDSDCFYIVIAETNSLFEIDEPRYFVKSHNVKEDFLAFAKELDRLFELRLEEEAILQKIGIKSSGKFVFGQPTEIKIEEKDIPIWVNEVKFPTLRQLEEQRGSLQTEIDRLDLLLPLLYGTSDNLEMAVIHALRFLGLEAEKTEKGFTVDIRAQTLDASRKFGLEVTGIKGQVKKESNKLTQLMDFERIKEHGEKTVLVANTYNEMPISQRKSLDDFTPQVLSFLERHPILIMTSWDLYCMVGDVLDNKRTKEELIDMLYTTNGRLNYSSSNI